jgi:hypothetical protein
MMILRKIEYGAYFIFSPIVKVLIVLGIVAAIGLTVTGIFSVLAIMY